MRLFLLILLISVSSATQAANTVELFESWRNRVLQVQVIDRQADTKAGIGSGFFAGQPGWVITNYHVIAELLNQPGRYRARFLADGGIEGDLVLLAVDAVHDLALLRSSDYQAPALPLAAALPPRGSRTYSMGFPYDIGLTIVEGTFNGMLKKSLYEKLHFTGSINPGMSGGPALNESGEVVGVNVSTAGNQVSFLVPVQFVESLVRSADGQDADVDKLNREVARQLLENQHQISESLLDRKVKQTVLEGYKVPGGLADYINCWGNSQNAENGGLASVYYRCQTQDDIFLSSSLTTGIIRYQHEFISGEHFYPMRFYRQLEQRGYYPRLRLEGDEQSVSNYRCRSDFVEHQKLPSKVTFCVRRYLKFEGLYDAYLESTSLLKSREALQSTLLLAGFSWENLVHLSERFIESIGREEHAP